MAGLEVQNLKKSFGDTPVLKGVSFSLESGKVLAIIGSSGSGKTTLLRTLNFLESADSGQILVDGAPLLAPKMTEKMVRQNRSRFGLVFQNFNLFPQYTALQNVMLAPKLQKKGTKTQLQERAEALLTQVGLADKMSFYLSDGFKNVPRDFTVAVCAGMGADTIQSVLENAPWLRSEKYRLILQCQSRRPQLRRYLSENSWRITEESVIRDGRFLYTVMEVYWEPAYPKLTPGEWFFPPAIMENPSKYTATYYDDAVFRLNRELAGKKDTADPTLQAALTELENMKEIVDDIRS